MTSVGHVCDIVGHLWDIDEKTQKQFSNPLIFTYFMFIFILIFETRRYTNFVLILHNIYTELNCVTFVGLVGQLCDIVGQH